MSMTRLLVGLSAPSCPSLPLFTWAKPARGSRIAVKTASNLNCKVLMRSPFRLIFGPDPIYTGARLREAGPAVQRHLATLFDRPTAPRAGVHKAPVPLPAGPTAEQVRTNERLLLHARTE